MSEPTSAPSLFGWILRDLMIVLVLAAVLYGLWEWGQTAGWPAALAGSVVGFVSAYVVCYIVHEWGHLIGGRLAGARMPLNRYASPLLGLFDIAAHSPAQFLALSWGGVCGYLMVAVMSLILYAQGGAGWVGAGVATGGLAFVVQSLAVDLPQILRVMRGEAPLAVSQSGATGAIILRRTWQTWIPLALALCVWNVVR